MKIFIIHRIAKTYDQFLMNLEFEDLENRENASEPNAIECDVSFVAMQQSLGYSRGINTPARSNLIQKRRNPNELTTGNQSFNAGNNQSVRRVITDSVASITDEVVRDKFAREEKIIDDCNALGADHVVQVIESDDEVQIIDDVCQSSPEKASEVELSSMNGSRGNKTTCHRTPGQYTAERRIRPGETPSASVASAPAKQSKPRPSTSTEQSTISRTSSNQTNANHLFTCEVCGYTNRRRDRLARHVEDHKNKPFQCDVCTRKFADKDMFHMHYRIHEYRCGKCRKKFDGNTKLQAHEQLCNARRFECYMCKFYARSEHSLKIHLRKHSGEKPYSCQLCFIKFKEIRTLRKHMKIIHKTG